MKRFMLQRGFTFVELMVVVAIMGILASVLYASFGDARANARDSAFKTELKEVQLALELYKAQNGSYPLPPDDSCRSSASAMYSASSDDCSVPVISGIIPDFISELPDPDQDSTASSCSLVYRTSVDGSWYKLSAIECVSSDTLLTFDAELARCPERCDGGSRTWCDEAESDFNQSWAIYSVGGECQE